MFIRLALSLLLPISIFAADVPIAMVAATSFESDLPFELIEGREWRAEKGARFVKLHLYLDQPANLTGLRLTACSPFDAPVRAYVNFDAAIHDIKPAGTQAAVDFPAIEARSVTFNFQNGRDLCLKSLQLLTAAGPLKLVPPRIVQAKVKASSTLKPELSYDVMNLFDSRMEYAWSSSGKGKGEVISFEFSAPEQITKLRIYNGYQRSDVHCQSNARVRTLQLTGDNGYDVTVSVPDVLGGSEIVLQKPFNGKNLKLTIKDVYPGRAYQDLVISELRFFDGARWFMPDPRPAMRAVESVNARAFAKAGMEQVLNSTLSMYSTPFPGEFAWRFRKDGSFYLEGSSMVINQSSTYYALGNYEVKESAPGTVEVRIFGVLRKTTTYISMDCNGCGRDCNKPGDTGEGIFEQYIRFSVSRLNPKDPAAIHIVTSRPGGRIEFERLIQKPGE